MNQDSGLNIAQQSSRTLQEYPACFDSPRGVVRQLNDRTARNPPVQLSLFLEFPQPQKKAIDRLLGTLYQCQAYDGEYMNDWGIPDWLEKEVKERDKTCVYCGIKMVDRMPPRGPRKAVATWEHIINDESIVTGGNIARCCVACNSSKGTKKLSDWLQSSYCKKHGINKDTVAEVVKQALRDHA